MSQSPTLSRRELMLGAAAMPLVLGAAKPALSAAEMLGVNATRFSRMKVGAFEVTTLLTNTITVPGPQNIFGMNVSAEEFGKVSAEANLPVDKAQFFFTPTVVNTGNELILFDTGQSPEGISAALAQAGYSNDQIDIVVITHMHGDHIGGLADAQGATFPNARYVTGAVEYDSWAKAGHDGFDTLMRPLAAQTSMIQGGGSVASGITAVEAFGHTPGHMAYMIESNGQQMLIAADFANHYVWSLAHPDWEVKFDMDKGAAAATRRRLLDMMAADKIAFVGYHMPWPGVGYVEAKDSAYQYVPSSYQMML